MSQYTAIGLANAQAGDPPGTWGTMLNTLLGWVGIQRGPMTATQVVAMTYEEIADLCEVTLGADGSSPADFFYVNERAFIVSALTPPPAEPVTP